MKRLIGLSAGPSCRLRRSGAPRHFLPLIRHELPHPVHRHQSQIMSSTHPSDELSIVHRTTPEGRLSDPSFPEKLFDLIQKFNLRAHTTEY